MENRTLDQTLIYLTQHKQKGWVLAKNLGDWYFGEMPETYNFETSKQELARISICAWGIGDKVFAAENFRKLLAGDCSSVSAGDVEQMRGYIKEYDNRLADYKKNVICSDERLKPIIERLGYVYGNIDKNIVVYVSKSEEEYNEYFKKKFPNVKEIHPYAGFIATGFYYDENVYHLVFKQHEIDMLGDIELLGLCAHEMAHLDLVAKGIQNTFNTYEKTEIINQFINEHLTDFYAISRGFGYALYKNRALKSPHPALMSADEIKRLILTPEKL